MRRLLNEWDERETHPSGQKRKPVLFLMAELNPQKIATIRGIDAWVQISCPRLSIDWGAEFKQVPLPLSLLTLISPLCPVFLCSVVADSNVV
jgi:hypothetical protein